jgi:acetyl esterase/lipase
LARQIGFREADYLSPGGGYCIPVLPGHFAHVEALCTELQQCAKDVSVLFLAYDPVPKARWPHHLYQAVSILQYAIEVLGKRPSDIILQGDSASGHLVLAVLSCLAHPNRQPGLPRYLVIEPLAGAMLLSPWVDFRIAYPSYSKAEMLFRKTL